MYCTRCGAQTEDSARFCTACGAPTTLEGEAYSAPRKRLHRVMADKKIAGVCAGFAEYFDMDVTLVRLIWLALVLIPAGAGIIVYLVAWIVLPRD
jgi:phage shock protein C